MDRAPAAVPEGDSAQTGRYGPTGTGRDARRILLPALGSALGLGLILGLVWAMVLREGKARGLYLEFEAFRAATALADEFRATGGLSRDERVLAFGLYGPEGERIASLGPAPASLDPAGFLRESLKLEARKDSIVVRRVLGDAASQRRMMGRGRGMGMMGQGLEPAPFAGSGGAAAPGGAALPAPAWLGPRFAYVEYSASTLLSERRALYLGAGLVTLGLGALYAWLLHLFRKNAELRAAELRNRELVELGEAARTLAHEIKNPLGIVRIQTGLIRRRAGEAETSLRAAALIEEEVARLSELSDRVRDFLRGGEGSPVELELGPWLEDFLARRRGSPEAAEAGEGAVPAAAESTVTAFPSGALVRVDPERLGLALGNLWRNAEEADPGRSPELALELVPGRRGRRWEISVLDRGPGVGPGEEERIFTPFHTTKEKGTGIGLSIARRVAREAGGDLEYRAREGGGARFALSLPAR